MIGSRSNHRDGQDQEHFEEVTNNDSANNLDRGLVNDVVTEDFQVCRLHFQFINHHHFDVKVISLPICI